MVTTVRHASLLIDVQVNIQKGCVNILTDKHKQECLFNSLTYIPQSNLRTLYETHLEL